MCAIVSSFDRTQLSALLAAQQHRGTLKNSVFTDNEMFYYDGKYSDDVDMYEGYNIVHLHAPTSSSSSCQPSMMSSSMLWHNGMLMPKSIFELSNQYPGLSEGFDTALLHAAILHDGFGALNGIEGSFACIYLVDDAYYVFRSKHAQMYIDDNLTVSTERFDGSNCINYDTVYKLDLNNKSCVEVDTFRTCKFNIVVPGEMIK